MPLSRRSFIRASALAVVGFPALVRARNLNSALQIAAVGVDGKGHSDILEVGSHPKAKFVAFCDIDSTRFAHIEAKYPGLPRFADYREMFTKLGDGFDAVTVSTPDHSHALPTLLAMRLGKHVYCQKPLTHTVAEARLLRLAAEKHKVRTQMGNQIHSATEYRTAVRLIQSGRIGKVLAVHSWQPNSGNGYTKLRQPPPSGSVPPSVNWDLWLGGAEERPYAPEVYHPFNWRDWIDFGSGTLGDFGCHIMDPVYTALKLTAPVSVKADSQGANPHTWCQSQVVQYTYPGTQYTAGRNLILTWYDGGNLPDLALALMPPGRALAKAGSLFIGEQGVLMLPHVGPPMLFPEDKFGANLSPGELARRARKPELAKAGEKVAVTLADRVEGSSHYHAWVDAAIDGHETTDNFAYAGPLTEAVQLGNIASRFSGQLLEWDAQAMRITNVPSANALLYKKYRKGWELGA